MAEHSRFTMFHFSQANPVGAEHDSLPALLRRVADTIEGLGDVEVYDLVLNPPRDAQEEPPRRAITVYYDDRAATYEGPDAS